MIRLTRLRSAEPLYLNPDHFERLEQNHDTTVHMTNGAEYIVTEDAETIVARILTFRASVIARAANLQADPYSTKVDVGSNPTEPLALLSGDAGNETSREPDLQTAGTSNNSAGFESMSEGS